MNRKTWALFTAIMGLVTAAVFWADSIWQFWDPEPANKWILWIGDVSLFAWSLLYFMLRNGRKDKKGVSSAKTY